LVAAAAAGIGLMMDTTTAAAVPAGLVAPYTWVPGNFGNSNGGTYLGRLISMNAATKAAGPYVFCITAGAATPVNPRLQAVQTGGFNGEMGYLITRFQNNAAQNNPQALSYLAHASYDSGNGISGAAARALVVKNTPAAIVTRANQLRAEAKEYSGVPKVVIKAVKGDLARHEYQYSVEVLTANGRHRLAGAVTLTLTRTSGTGKAVFKDSGTASLTVQAVTNAARPVIVSYLGLGAWQINGTTKAVYPGNGISVFTESGHQTSIGAAPATPATAGRSALSVGARTPTITTQSTATGGVQFGQGVADRVALENGWPGDTVSVKAELWKVASAGQALPAVTSTMPANAVMVHQATAIPVTFAANGTAQVAVPAFAPSVDDAAGWYTWRVTTTAGQYTQAAAAPWNVPAESFEVQASPLVIESTALVAAAAGPGDSVEDAVQLAGGAPGDTVSVSATLYQLSSDATSAKPVPSQSQPPGARLVAGPFTTAVTLDAQGAAALRFGPYVIAADDVGWYSWVIAVTNSASGLTPDTSSAYAEDLETFLLEPAPALRVTTRAVQPRAEAGDVLTDELQLWTGGADLTAAPAVIDSSLWGPYPTPPALSPNWPADQAKLVGTVSTTMTAQGTATSPGIGVSQRGYYVWTAHLKAGSRTVHQPAGALAVTSGTDPGDLDIWVSVDGLPGGYDLDGTVELRRLSEDASVPAPTAVPPGAPVVALSAGQSGFQAQASAAGLIGWRQVSVLPGSVFVDPDGDIRPGWYGLSLAGGATGEAEAFTTDPLDALVLVSELGGDMVFGFGPAGDPVAPDLTGLALPVAAPPGQVQVYGEYRSGFGEAVETTLVPFEPQITTITSEAVAEAGAELSDQLELTGGAPGARYQVVTRLYGPFDSPPVKAAKPPAGAPVVGSVTTTLTADSEGKATGRTTALTLQANGYYVWVEEIAPDLLGKGSKGWTGAFGEASETTLVPYRPALASLVSQARLEPGSPLSDSLSITGGQPNGRGMVLVGLYGPFATDPTRDLDGLGTFDDPRDVPMPNAVVVPGGPPADAPLFVSYKLPVVLDGTGAAVVETPEVVVSQGGYYVYSAVFEPEDGVMIATVERFGEVSETAFVPWQPDVKTEASSAVAEVGATLFDNLVVSNLGPNRTKVTAYLYGPYGSQPDLSAAVPANAPLAGQVELEVDGDGHYTTPGITVHRAGYYVWVEEVEASPDGRVKEAKTAFGIAKETTLVTAEELAFTGGGQGALRALVLAPTLILLGAATCRAAYLRRRRGIWRRAA